MRQRITTVFILLLAVSAGCVATKEVKEIVASSNAAMISNGVVGQANESAPDWRKEVARIEAFIENHPGADVTNAALRVREGMLLAAHKQDAFATQAFEQVKDRGKLVSARDRALFDLHPHIIWWFMVSEQSFDGKPPLDKDAEGTKDYKRASDALAAFRTVCDKGDAPAAGSGARMYLEEMRAWIASSCAKGQTNLEVKQSIFQDGLDRYAEQFTTEDIAWLKKNEKTAADSVPFLVLKRRLRAKAVVERYREIGDPSWLAESDNQKTMDLLAAIPVVP
ncbi:MAG: hypothetical protein ACYTGN_12540 [Planctomycetota bacterium]|jgi:hypothetical protein